MLTFFRRIRKRLLGTGATRKYLVYAIGEILLVMIGILLALQVNNWNEKRKDQNHVSHYLNNLAETIQEDIDMHRQTASLNTYRFNTLQYLLKISGNDPLGLKPIPIDTFRMTREYLLGNTLLNVSQWQNEFPKAYDQAFIVECFRVSVNIGLPSIKSSVFDEMKSTGMMSKIEQTKLKKVINEYYAFCDTFLEKNGDWNERLTLSWQEFVRDNYGIVLTGISVLGNPVPLLEEKDVIKRIQEMVAPAAFRARNSHRAIELAENILSEISFEQQ